MTTTNTTPCNGEAFRSIVEGVSWPRLLCAACVWSTVNGGECYGKNWETVEGGSNG